jgi:hypothetical protein
MIVLFFTDADVGVGVGVGVFRCNAAAEVWIKHLSALSSTTVINVVEAVSPLPTSLRVPTFLPVLNLLPGAKCEA